MTDYQFYKRMGICPSCRKEKLFGTEGYCVVCKAYFAMKQQEKRDKNPEEERKKHRESVKRLAYQRRENGQCYVCGRILKDLKYKACPYCRAKKNKWERERKAKNS